MSTKRPIRERIGGGKSGVLDSIIKQLSSSPTPIKTITSPTKLWVIETSQGEHWLAKYDDMEHGSGHGLVAFRSKKTAEDEMYRYSKDPNKIKRAVQVDFQEATMIALSKVDYGVSKIMVQRTSGFYDFFDLRNG